jgi:hypothetical protein
MVRKAVGIRTKKQKPGEICIIGKFIICYTVLEISIINKAEMEEMGETNSTRVGYEKVRDFSMED